MLKVKIVYVIGTLDVGGTEGQLVELVLRLDQDRFDPVVCCLSPGGALEGLLTERGIPVHVVNFRGFRKATGGFIRSAPHVARAVVRLWRLLRGERPAIVHGFLFWAYILGGLVARAARVPIFVSSRRSLGHFKADKPHYLFWERMVNRITDLVIANSEAVRQDVILRERLPASKVMVIYNGLDLSRFDIPPDEQLRESLGLSKRAPVIGIVANFIHYKGYEFFLEAWASVVKKCPEGVALLVGDGPLRQEFEAKVEAVGLGQWVRFLGTRQDVPRLLALMDLVVHPSLEEGFSNAILEAMAAGRPVIATTVGGNAEAVIQGKTGLLVPPRDSEALANAMLRLLEHPAEAAEFGGAGRRRVAEQFQLPAMVRQYQEVYERLVHEKYPARMRAQRQRGKGVS